MKDFFLMDMVMVWEVFLSIVLIKISSYYEEYSDKLKDAYSVHYFWGTWW